jgi:two-component system OmpR family response regulator
VKDREAAVLVVEDDYQLGEMFHHMLSPAYKVALVSTVSQAVQALHNEEFAVAVVDIGLPDGSGFDVCEAIAAIQPAVAMLMMTGANADEYRAAVARLGAHAVLAKPIQFKMLTAFIRVALKRYREVKGEPEDDGELHA